MKWKLNSPIDEETYALVKYLAEGEAKKGVRGTFARLKFIPRGKPRGINFNGVYLLRFLTGLLIDPRQLEAAKEGLGEKVRLSDKDALKLLAQASKIILATTASEESRTFKNLHGPAQQFAKSPGIQGKADELYSEFEVSSSGRYTHKM